MPCKRAQLLSPIAAAFWMEGRVQQEVYLCCTASGGFEETADQLWAAWGLFEVFQLFRPAWPSAGGCGTGQHTGNLTLTLCEWDPARSGLPTGAGITSDWSSQDAVDVMVTFSSVFKSLCSTSIIIILTRAVGSKALQKQGREALLTLLVCVFLLGFYPDFSLSFYSTWFLPASRKPHLFGERKETFGSALYYRFCIVTVSLSHRAKSWLSFLRSQVKLPLCE